jgi:hypothetical protein
MLLRGHLLTFAGVAPIIERSGTTIVTHCRWFCPTLLRQSFHEFAGQSIQYSQWAKAFYRQQRMRGKDHQAAVRSLACKWTRMIFQMWPRTSEAVIWGKSGCEPPSLLCRKQPFSAKAESLREGKVVGYAAMDLERQVSFSAMLSPCRCAPLFRNPLNFSKQQEHEHRENN